MWNKIKGLFDAKMLRFLIVGVVNTLFGTTLMFVLYNCWLDAYGSTGYWISSAANYFFGSILSYFLNKYFTFRNHERGWRPILRFTLNITVCYLLARALAAVRSCAEAARQRCDARRHGAVRRAELPRSAAVRLPREGRACGRTSG